MSQEDSYVLYDAAGKVLWLSRVASPYKLAEVIGKPAWSALRGRDAETCQAAIMRALAEKKIESFEALIPGIGIWRTTLYPCRVGPARLVGVGRQVPPGAQRLSDRQREICKLLAGGLNSKAIAKRLGIARSTVDNTRSRAADKLGIKPASLIAWCAENLAWL